LPVESDTEAAEDAKKYSTFWKEFGKAIKLGIIEDVQNRQRLAKLMRFETSKSGSKEIGLDAYIANMKEGQKSIYYLAGQHRAAIFALQNINTVLCCYNCCCDCCYNCCCSCCCS